MNYRVEYTNQNWEAAEIEADSPSEAAKRYILQDQESRWTDYDQIAVSWGLFGKHTELYRVQDLVSPSSTEREKRSTSITQSVGEAPEAPENSEASAVVPDSSTATETTTSPSDSGAPTRPEVGKLPFGAVFVLGFLWWMNSYRHETETNPTMLVIIVVGGLLAALFAAKELGR